jgi:hypothetical protein
MRKVFGFIGGVVLAYVLVSSLLFTYRLSTAYFQTQQPSVEVTEGITKTIHVAVLPPDQVAHGCGGSALGCTWTFGSQCILFLPPIPEQGRSPSLAGTGWYVAESLVIWGHELAHCVGVDIHGEGE